MDNLESIAEENLKLFETGSYLDISFKNELEFARDHTCTITPKDCARLLLTRGKKVRKEEEETTKLQIRVTQDKTEDASRRMVVDEELPDLLVLNFASAKNRGGGFLKGARAQEECLCRASCLYPCLASPSADLYYQLNHRHKKLDYTDAMIYSPSIPFFRSSNHQFLDSPYLASVLTCPAPNALALQRAPTSAFSKYEELLHSRVGKILAVAEEKGHRNLLLGAWGCGVFRNDPFKVANSFETWLLSERFAGSFSVVEFAVYDRSYSNFSIFTEVLLGEKVPRGDKKSAFMDEEEEEFSHA